MKEKKQRLILSNAWEDSQEMDEFVFEERCMELSRFFNDGSVWLLKGTIQRWNGVFEGGFTFKTLNEMFSHMDRGDSEYRIYDENGHLKMEQCHHDGINHFEIKRLRASGEAILDTWNRGFINLSMRELHAKLFNYYSTVPNYAHKIYGAPMREYVERKGDCLCV